MNKMTPIEENYLKVIYEVQQKNLYKAVCTNDLSYTLGYKPATVTEMLKKLAQKKYIKYKKYYGVSLTIIGEQIAIQVMRRHRLWEYFLVYKLGFQWEDIHDIAEELEHVQSQLLIDKLDKYLEYPTTDPHGEPIPNRQGQIKKVNHFLLLSNVEIGKRVKIIMINDDSKEFLSYLNKIKMSIGSEWIILSKEIYDESIFLKSKNNKSICISKIISANIFVHEI